MNFIKSMAVSTVFITGLVASAFATPTDIFTRDVNPAQNLLIFPNKKGEVIFSHSAHLKGLKEDQCILCHRVENPTLESIQTRFENHRLAHSFCKGCHATMGKGPTDCQQCHNYTKTI